MPAMVYIPKRKRRRRNVGKIPDSTPPVPPAELQVVSVTLEMMAPTIVYWEFSMDIADPTDVSGLTAAEQPGMYWTRVAPNTIYVEYFQGMSQGQNWQALAGAVESVDGEALVAANGSMA